MASDSEGDDAAVPVVVAVVSWNTRDLLDRCLSSLKTSVDSGTAEVWVVDNASTDGSPEMVSDRHPWAQLVSSDKNLGYGAAINFVASRTSSAWLAIANSDIVIRPGAFEQLLATAQADERVGAVAPRLVLPDGSTQHSVWPFPTIATTIAQNLGPRVVPPTLADRLALLGAWDSERARAVPWAVGAFLLVRRRAFDESGRFDTTQWMSAEDLDLGWRLRAAGWITLYEPNAVVDHAESSATRQVWGDSLRIHWQRCAYAWMLHRLGRPRTATMGALNFLGAIARLLVYFAAAGFRLDARVRAFGRWTLVHAYAFAPRKTLERFR